MAGLEALPSVQCVSVKGEWVAVVNIEDWEALLEWLETSQDVPIAREAYARLKAPGGDQERAGWLRGVEVKRETFGRRQTFCFVK
jgi:hypothetical protein